MKKPMLVTVIVLAVIVILSIFRDAVIKTAISAAISEVTGTRTEIGGLSLGILSQKVYIKNFKIYNPPEFPKGILLDMPKIKISWDMPSFFRGKIHLTGVEVDLKEALILKNKKGELNVDSLKVAKKEGSKEGNIKRNQTNMQIDSLNLNLGWVIFKDLSGVGGKPVIDGYDIQVKNRVYKNITSAEQLVSIILMESLKHTAIKSAEIYSASSLAGVAFAPLAAAFLFTSKDYAEYDFHSGEKKVFAAAIGALQELGALVKDNEQTGTIIGNVRDADITVELKEAGGGKTKAKVFARKFMFPEPAIAGGILYEMMQKSK